MTGHRRQAASVEPVQSLISRPSPETSADLSDLEVTAPAVVAKRMIRPAWLHPFRAMTGHALLLSPPQRQVHAIGGDVGGLFPEGDQQEQAQEDDEQPRG